ncbi:MAG: hypothetical protein RLZZ324_1359, partial [Candidatus Parcubacteria bacterium]
MTNRANVSIPVPALVMVFCMGVVSVFGTPIMAMGVFAAFWLSANMAASMFLPPAPGPLPNDEIATVARFFAGRFADWHVSHGVEQLVAYGSGIAATLVVAVCLGLILTALQTLLAKFAYRSAVASRRFLLPTLLANSLYAATFFCIGYGVFASSMSMDLGGAGMMLWPFIVVMGAFVAL